MRKKFSVSVVVLAVVGFGLAGLAQPSSDGSAPYPSPEKGAEPAPQVAWCAWEYRYDQWTPWEFAYAIHRCNLTHRCPFRRGCYHVNFYKAYVDVYRRWCCYVSAPWIKFCEEWVYIGSGWRIREGAREFLGCGCTGVTPDQSSCTY